MRSRRRLRRRSPCCWTIFQPIPSRCARSPRSSAMSDERPDQERAGRLYAKGGCEPANSFQPRVATTPASLKSSPVLVLVVLRLLSHPLLLVGGEGLIERLPRLGEFLEVCCFLSHCISALVIAVAQDSRLLPRSSSASFCKFARRVCRSLALARIASSTAKRRFGHPPFVLIE